MGSQDRDYMRSRQRPFFAPDGFWTIRLLILLIAAYVLQQFLGRGFDPTLSWRGLTDGRIWTLVTATITHADVGHLLGNLIGIYIFGKITEAELGPRGFVQLTVATGVLGWVPYLAAQAVTGDTIPTLGASGVVMAFLAVAALRRPHEKIYFWALLPIPIWVLGVLYVVSDLSGLSSQFAGGTGVNHLVHLTGAVFGFAAHRLDRSSPGSGFAMPKLGGGARRANPHIRAPGRLDPHSPEARAEVDRLLDKVSEKGIGSLTDEEREFLNRASRGYR